MTELKLTIRQLTLVETAINLSLNSILTDTASLKDHKLLGELTELQHMIKQERLQPKDGV